MYAMLLEGVLKEKIWGGNDLKDFGKKVENRKIGESWEVACHEQGASRVKNGRFKGLSLCDLLTDQTHEIFLDTMQDFPLLVKYINADDNLSLQVHPDDEYSHKLNQPYGKTEAWYILEAEEGAEIILGSTDKTLNILKEHIKSDEEINFTNRILVKPGEMYFVPAGTIHAIGKGIVLLEIQQNSDTTFRIHDYSRGRTLHLKDAIEVVRLDTDYRKCIGSVDEKEGYTLTTYIDTDVFSIEKIEVKNHYQQIESHDYQLLNCIEGSGMIVHEEGYTPFRKGDTILIPSKLDNYEIMGYTTLIRSYTNKKNRKELH